MTMRQRKHVFNRDHVVITFRVPKEIADEIAYGELGRKMIANLKKHAQSTPAAVRAFLKVQ